MSSNSKFNLTHPFFSRQLAPRPINQQYEGRYQQTSTYFRKRSNSKNYELNNQSMFRIESFSSSKISNKQLIQNINSAFNPKQLIQKEKVNQSTKAAKKAMTFLSEKGKEAGKKIGMAIDTKRFWEKYLNEEISHGDLTKQLNKNIISNQSFRGRSKSQMKSASNNIGHNCKKAQKSAFYVNNFLRKRKNYLKMKEQQEEILKINEKKQKDPQTNNEQLKVKLKRHRVDNIRQATNQRIVPWQKNNQGYEDSFNLQY